MSVRRHLHRLGAGRVWIAAISPSPLHKPLDYKGTHDERRFRHFVSPLALTTAAILITPLREEGSAIHALSLERQPERPLQATRMQSPPPSPPPRILFSNVTLLATFEKREYDYHRSRPSRRDPYPLSHATSIARPARRA